MTLSKFKNKTRRKSTEELFELLITFNKEYYLCLKLLAENPSPPCPQEDKKYIDIIERKIEYINSLLQQRLLQQ